MTTTPATLYPRASPSLRSRAAGLRCVREAVLLALLYLGYALSRVLASDDFAPARERASRIVDLERVLHLDIEHQVVRLFAEHDLLGLAAAYYYACAHYVLTLAALLWLFVRHRGRYPHARTTLVLSTLLALGCYLLMPTAPPRLVGYADLMALHSGSGWWGEAASAPQGLGWMTNQLAAFPSMHAGWALWVALAVGAATTSRVLRAAAWAHAVVTAVVVVGTGNHWILDVVLGWALVLLMWQATMSAHASTAATPGLLGMAAPAGQPPASRPSA